MHDSATLLKRLRAEPVLRRQRMNALPHAPRPVGYPPPKA